MFDASTGFLFAKALGITKREMLARYDAAGFPMVDARAKFHAPTVFGDDVRIESTAGEFRLSSFDVRHRLFHGDTLAVEAFETRVWVGRDPDDPGRIKSRPIPQEIVDLLSANAEAKLPPSVG
jgi:4-hydroxybenzoyl-CoA thioesterase